MGILGSEAAIPTINVKTGESSSSTCKRGVDLSAPGVVDYLVDLLDTGRFLVRDDYRDVHQIGKLPAVSAEKTDGLHADL